MELYRIQIDDFIISTDNIIIKYKKDKFISNIVKGSIDFKIVNEDNREIPLSYINVGDKIKIYGNKIGKNNIIIKKIIIKNKYIFNSESSEDLDIYIN
jgi:hypothetical protein